METLNALPKSDIQIWTDGSVIGGVKNGGSGIRIEYNDHTEEFSVPAGKVSSSFRAEKIAILTALNKVEIPTDIPRPYSIRICSDSLSAILQLEQGPHKQNNIVDIQIWNNLTNLSREANIHLQWVPGHANIGGNERADALAKEGTGLDQSQEKIDLDSAWNAIKRKERKEWLDEVKILASTSDSDSLKWFMENSGGKPSNLQHPNINRKTARVLEQIRMGKSYCLQKTKAELGIALSSTCPHCETGEDEDARHFMMTCPRWTAIRTKLWGLFASPEEVLRDGKKFEEYARRSGHLE